MNCDRIARSYRWFEYAAFGRALERHRVHYLPHLTDCSQALLLGDGDGRFLVELTSTNPAIRVDSIEASAVMLSLAQGRIAAKHIPSPSRIRLLHGDAFEIPLAPDRYDLVVTNFFFDCFSTASIARLIDRIVPACRANTRWIVSEFQQPATGWRAWHARLWLTTMYRFFGLTTGLSIRKLPRYETSLLQARFRLSSRTTSRAGLICSELWQGLES
jgi:ubiquinone/menaquinone biosynthesis C-methylase UbiE